MGRFLVVISLPIFLFAITEATFLGYRGGVVPVAVPLPIFRPIFRPIVRPIIRPMPYFKKGYVRGNNIRPGGRSVGVTSVTNVVGTRDHSFRGVSGGRQIIPGTPSTGVNEVVVIVNDRDCYGGVCGVGGLGGGIGGGIGGVGQIGGAAMGFDGLGNGLYSDGGDNGASFMDMVDPRLGRRADVVGDRGNYNIMDADTVVIGGNGRM